jgi:hypothetical protein
VGRGRGVRGVLRDRADQGGLRRLVE